MSTTRLSSKGQLIIPKPVRKAHCWDTGQELDVVGALSYSGAAKTVEQMKEAIGKGIKARYS